MFRSSRVSHLAVGVLALTVVGCSDTTTNFVINSAAVRFVNDTDTPISVSTGGRLDTLNRRLVFGQSSTCLLLNLSNTTVPPITFMNAVTGVTIRFTPTLVPGDNVMVVAFGNTFGAVQLVAINNRFVPATNTAGLRFFNGLTAAGSMFMARNNVVLSPFVGVGSASNFVSVPIDSGRIVFSNASSVVLDAGLMAFPQGQNTTVLVGPAASDSTPRRFFTAQGC